MEEAEKVQAKIYLGTTKEENLHLAERLELSDEATQNFRYAFLEVECDIEVNKETGIAKLLKVDGKRLIDDTD